MHKILAVQEGNADKLNATQKEMMRLCKEDMPVALVDYYTVQCRTRVNQDISSIQVSEISKTHEASG